MRVPVAAPTRLAPAEAADVRAAVARVLADGPWILGPEVAAFEAELGAYVGVPDLVGVGNGTDALVVAMAALGLASGEAVLVAANEGGYAAVAARQLGLTVRVTDVDPVTMGPTVDLLEAAWASDVAVVVVTHLHGDAVPVAEVADWCRARGIPLVEDCAQAHGLRVDGRHVGAAGDAATYSFYPTKNLGAVGDGGAVAFRDPEVAERARLLRQYGWGERFRCELPQGRNTRLDPLQAAVLRARLPYLDTRNARRRELANRFRACLAGSALRLHGDAETSVAHHAVLLTEDREEVRDLLADAGVDTTVHYPFLVGEMPGLAAAPAVVPTAAALRDRVLSVPCFPELTEAEADRVCTALTDVAARHG